ncbi:hypothetical protein B0H19DRAFT_80159 [Mycena capillaripes]|nr:hypothetical protein B0H19DRAFT_80159 [Mycena capillaripes]
MHVVSCCASDVFSAVEARRTPSAAAAQELKRGPCAEHPHSPSPSRARSSLRPRIKSFRHRCPCLCTPHATRMRLGLFLISSHPRARCAFAADEMTALGTGTPPRHQRDSALPAHAASVAYAAPHPHAVRARVNPWGATRHYALSIPARNTGGAPADVLERCSPYLCCTATQSVVSASELMVWCRGCHNGQEMNVRDILVSETYS